MAKTAHSAQSLQGNLKSVYSSGIKPFSKIKKKLKSKSKKSISNKKD